MHAIVCQGQRDTMRRVFVPVRADRPLTPIGAARFLRGHEEEAKAGVVVTAGAKAAWVNAAQRADTAL